MPIEFKWATRQCHSLVFRMEVTSGFADAIVGVSEDSIVG